MTSTVVRAPSLKAAAQARQDERDRKFTALWRNADQAGRDAVAAATVDPMIVTGTRPDGTSQSWYVADGVCGFAWVNFPGNTAFARWAKAQDLVRRDSYYGGVTYWVGGYGQSMQKKETYARAFAEVLRAAGVAKVSAQSRMD
jgi:hypothetical protein